MLVQMLSSCSLRSQGRSSSEDIDSAGCLADVFSPHGRYSTGEADRVAHSGWWVEYGCVLDTQV